VASVSARLASMAIRASVGTDVDTAAGMGGTANMMVLFL
jgi:hypothetical protein